MKKIFFLVFCFCATLQQTNAQCIVTLPASKDASTNSGFLWADTNVGGDVRMSVMSWTFSGIYGNIRSFIHFDLSNLNLQNCIITSARIVLHQGNFQTEFHCGTHPCLSNEFQVSRIIEPWNEYTITANNQPLDVASVMGPDYITITNNDLPYYTYDIDITDIVNYWVANPNENYGVKMQLVNESLYRRVAFATREHAIDSLRPQLILEVISASSAPLYCERISGNGTGNGNNNLPILATANIPNSDEKPIVSNAFSPNGDGSKDYFLPVAVEAEYIKEFRVFNRIGQEIYNNPNTDLGWNGEFGGQILNSDIYFYVFVYELPNQKPITLSGSVLLTK